MNFFGKIYDAIKKFFNYLSFKKGPDYMELNNDDNIEEVTFIYNNIIS